MRRTLPHVATGLLALTVLAGLPARCPSQILYARPYSGSYFRNTNYGTAIYLEPNVRPNLANAYPNTFNGGYFYTMPPLTYNAAATIGTTYAVVPPPAVNYYAARTPVYAVSPYYNTPVVTPTVGGRYFTATDVGYQPAGPASYFNPPYGP
jgi:hypothetical protein